VRYALQKSPPRARHVVYARDGTGNAHSRCAFASRIPGSTDIGSSAIKCHFCFKNKKTTHQIHHIALSANVLVRLTLPRNPRSVDPRIRDAKAHLERELPAPSRAYTTWRARGRGFRRAYLTVNGCPSRVLAVLRMFGGISAESGRRAERTPANSDRADRLKPNIVFSNRDSFQRRGHSTVCKVAFYRLTLPRSRCS